MFNNNDMRSASLNIFGLLKAASEEVDWSVPDASYNSPYLISGMRLTPQQNEAYQNRKLTHGRENAKAWLKQNYGKTGRTQKVDESKYPTSTMTPAPAVSTTPTSSPAPTTPAVPAKPSRAALSANSRMHRTRVGNRGIANQGGLYNPGPNRTPSLAANSSTSSMPNRMNPYKMSEGELMGWVQNHASEIVNNWHKDPYYYEMAKQVANIQDPRLMSDFDADPNRNYGTLETRIKSMFRDAAKPYASMLQGNAYDPVSSGGFGAYSRGR